MLPSPFWNITYMFSVMFFAKPRTLIVRSDRDDMVHGEVAHDTCLDLNLLCVCLPFHLVAGFEFVLLPRSCSNILMLSLVEVTLKMTGHDVSQSRPRFWASSTHSSE